MNDKYIAQIAKELTDCFEWMHRAGINNKDVTLDELIECIYDAYEVIVDIHLINGDVLTIRNECIKSFKSKQYSGARLESDFSDGNIIAEIFLSNHVIKIPLTSICWIDSHTENIDWEAYKRLKEIERIKKK